MRHRIWRLEPHRRLCVLPNGHISARRRIPPLHTNSQRNCRNQSEYSDLPGFSLRDQRFLSVLVRCHRRKFRKPLIEALPDNMHRITIQLVALMRLAVLLRRNRSRKPGPEVRLSATEQSIQLDFPPEWLKEHPLTLTDLDIEKKCLKPIGLKLEYS